MNFEEAFKRLEEISELMENDSIPLDEAVGLYSEAAKLVEFCKKSIENARLEVEKIDDAGK